MHHKKRSGQHQKQTKHYLKTYWPFLPIVAGGFIANVILEATMQASSVSIPASIAYPTRLDVWTNANTSLVIIVLALVIGAAALFITRHTRAWQRALVKGEGFILHHKSLDLLLVSVIVVGFVITRTV